MKKTIKRVTIITISLVLVLLYKTYILPEQLSRAQSQQHAEIDLNGNDLNQDNQVIYASNEPVSEYSSPGSVTADNFSAITEGKNDNALVTPSLSNTGVDFSSQTNKTTFSENTNLTKEDMANNNETKVFENNLSPTEMGYATASHGPNNNPLNVENTVSENIQAASSYNASRAESRVASTENATTASRVTTTANNNINVNLSSAPLVVIENPGGPNNGTDPYVPIDDYYGLFALLLCAGVIFWYRMKANKLVGVKA